MTDEASPRPWRREETALTQHQHIRDASGERVAEYVSGADAALIVEAVNAYDSESARFIFPDGATAAEWLQGDPKVQAVITAARDEVCREEECENPLCAAFRALDGEGE
jgi:hypothetical protein